MMNDVSSGMLLLCTAIILLAYSNRTIDFVIDSWSTIHENRCGSQEMV